MRKNRWFVIFLCFLAIAMNYSDRANLAVIAPAIQKELGIGASEMGLLLSGFFWTYALMQMPFGWCVDRVGARIALPLAVGWWSIFTAVTAVASSMAGIFGCRILLGAGEAGAYPLIVGRVELLPIISDSSSLAREVHKPSPKGFN